ncbi:MAG TPA: ATP-binding protein [Gemmatimonadaceae bacterium]|jgi:signal transduction histidine kinase
MRTLNAVFEHPPIDTDDPLVPHRQSARVNEHAVLFYEREDYLINLIAGFVAEGLRARQPAVVILAPHRLEPVTQALAGKGIDVAREAESEFLLFLDADETLGGLMDGERLMPDRFRAAVAPVVARSVTRNPSGIRAYGEMVDLLARRGNTDAAIEIEELWNELSHDQPISMLCGYHMGSFRDATHTAALARICRAHTSVRPTERFIEHDDAHRLIEIALLQQRAQALETELIRREMMEAELCNAIEIAERAKRAAEEANHAKSQFLAVMSHELRTPLNAIGGFAELLTLGILGAVNEEQRDALERIQRSQHHLLTLINQILSYARVETSSSRYDVSVVALAEVMRNVETIVLSEIAARKLRYTHVGCGTLAVMADRDKLQQILINLLSNAAKFTDAGGEIVVECLTEGPTAFVHVRDTGIGIPREKLSSIFEPFVQADRNYTRTRSGIGLGLAISREYARGMGCDLTVESEAGRGSVFTLALPRPAR